MAEKGRDNPVHRLVDQFSRAARRGRAGGQSMAPWAANAYVPNMGT
jgi:hypothetical protein